MTVNAPEGTLHEAFFDPVTDGTAVAADDSNGVLKPAAFTDANGASATLERIAWEPEVGESGTVKLQVNPPTGLTGQEVNFIALDGSVSLSLQVANATVDAANRTLSWAVGFTTLAERRPADAANTRGRVVSLFSNRHWN